MEEVSDMFWTRQLIKKAEPLPDRHPGEPAKKVRILSDEEVRKEAARVYQKYKAVMHRLAQ
jgi:hypothetical protein